MPKIYAVFCLNYIAMPFSVKIWCKTGFPSPDAYYGTRVRVRKIRIVPKIYAVFCLNYIAMPFSLKIVCKVVFANPDAYYGTQVRVRKIRMVRKIYAVIYLKYISNPFSVKIWCKTGFRKPRRVLRYASSGEQKPHRAEDLRCVLLKYISTRLA